GRGSDSAASFALSGWWIRVTQDERGAATLAAPRSPTWAKTRAVAQQETQLWLFFEPRRSRSATVTGNGEMRWNGPFAMSAVVRPFRATAVTSAPLSTR